MMAQQRPLPFPTPSEYDLCQKNYAAVKQQKLPNGSVSWQIINKCVCLEGAQASCREWSNRGYKPGHRVARLDEYGRIDKVYSQRELRLKLAGMALKTRYELAYHDRPKVLPA